LLFHNDCVIETIGEPSRGRKLVILASCCLSLLIVSMDMTIVNVAIPSIRDAFAAPAAQLQWVIDVYTLVLASLLLLAGTGGDRLGRRSVFQTGLVVFAIGSLLCSLAPSIGTLIAARFVQAVGGSMLTPVAMSIITQVFTDRVERARAIGVWGAVVGISMSVGPIVGGVLIQYVGWRSVFWINLPICAVAILLTAVFVPQSKSATMRGLDPVGQLLGVATLFSTVYVLIEAPTRGWADAVVTTMIAVAALSLTAFLFCENRIGDPFIDLRFFRSIPFASATLIAVCAFASFGAFLFMMSLYLQGYRGYSPMQTGLLYLPLAIGALIFSPLSGRLVGRYGARPSLVTAGILLTASAALMSSMSSGTPVWQLIVIFAIFGIGFSMVNAPVTTTAVSGMPTDRAGAAAGVTSTSRQVGVSLGVALCGSVASSAISAPGANFVADARPLWFVCAGMGAIVLAAGIFSTSPRALRSAERLAPLVTGPMRNHADIRA
jgi:EmrB/QacA subfamily drug resistance transporter